MKDKPNPVGRPTRYTPELCEEICKRVALGSNLNVICQEDGMPHQDTVYVWRNEIPDFSEKYEKARVARADARSDRIDDLRREIMNGLVEPAAAAVILKAEIWQAGRENPKKFGDRQIVQGDKDADPVNVNSSITVTDDILKAVPLDVLKAIAARKNGNS